jgi:hypothetical protein
MAKQLYTIDLASSKGGGDSLGSGFLLSVPRVIFALFSRYFCVIPHVYSRLCLWCSLPQDPRHSLVPPVPRALSACKLQNAEKTLSWKRTQRSGSFRIGQFLQLQHGGGLVHSEMWNLPIARNFIDACSQTQTTETAVRFLLYDLNTRYRIIRPRSSPTPKRVREMEQESEPTA